MLFCLTTNAAFILIFFEEMMSLPVFDVSDTGIQVNILDTLENIRLNMRINPPEAVD